ncbi:MAG: hypothetical protein AB7L13_01105 [Acidimicrobiia bacterium]
MFAGLVSKAAWYDALGSVPDFTALPSHDTESSLSVWRWVLAEAGEPLGRLLGRRRQLRRRSDRQLLAAVGFTPHLWLHGCGVIVTGNW